MPASYAYPAMVVLIALATVVPAFVVARLFSSSGPILGYFAGLGCGVLALVAEANLIIVVKWDDLFFVALLPLAGAAAAWVWPAKSSQKYRHGRMAGAAALLILAAALVYRTVGLQDTSIDIPFDVKSKGAISEVQFRVPTARFYTFSLALYFKEGDDQDRKRVQRLAGINQYGADGREIKTTGLPIPFRLIVERTDKEGAKPVIDGVFKDHAPGGWGASFGKIITRTELEPGRYRLRIEALENIPELENVPVRFMMYVPYH